MSLLLTKTCDYALLVALEDGQQFKGKEGVDIYVICRLNLKLPSQVDDLIPPNTRLSTRPTPFQEKPEFRTTLVYYLSDRLLSRLRKRQAQVTLDIVSLAEDCGYKTLGTIELHIKDAKLVKMRNGKRKMTQIQQFVVDKGNWLPIDNNVKGKIKAGLFITEMPNNMDSYRNKEMGTPLQMPVRTTSYHHNTNDTISGDLGLEICSDMSELFINSDKGEDSSDIFSQEEIRYDDEYGYEDDHRYQQDIVLEDEDDDRDNEEVERVLNIGEGEGQYSFLFRILEANHTDSITKNYPFIDRVYFKYEFSKQDYMCYAELESGSWKTIDYNKIILFQGDLQDIKEWLSDQSPIKVYICISQSNEDEELTIGFADIYLKDRDLNVVQQSSIIYDMDKNWHINSDKQFAKIQLQIGLIEGWDEPDLFNQTSLTFDK